MTNPRPRPDIRYPFAFDALAPEVTREIVDLQAQDGATSQGLFYSVPGRPSRIAAYLAHPRGDFTRHYLAASIPLLGIPVLGASTRYLNNDTDALHERLLYDVAAGLRHLKDRGFEKLLLVGNSGGGSLLGFYQSQAAADPLKRHLATTSGEPTGLDTADLPAGDLYVALAAHPGEGQFMLDVIDPSLVDESDPASCDPAWDMFNPANGYRPFPEPSRYDRAWLDAYRGRQRQRVARIDAIAKAAITERLAFREAAGALPPGPEQDLAVRRSRLIRYLLVYRTLANPAYLDPTVDPNRRPIGSIFSPGDPIITNYGYGGLGRTMTARGWLSTWSGLSSTANLYENIRDVHIPTLIVYADGDSDIFPASQTRLLENSGAADKSLATLEWANHYLRPVPGANLAEDPRDAAANLIANWALERAG